MFHCALIDTGAELCLIDYHFLRKSCINFSKIFVKIMDARVLLGDNVTEMTIRGYANISVSFINSDGVRVSSHNSSSLLSLGFLTVLSLAMLSSRITKVRGQTSTNKRACSDWVKKFFPHVAEQVHLPLHMPFTATVKAMAKSVCAIEVP